MFLYKLTKGNNSVLQNENTLCIVDCFHDDNNKTDADILLRKLESFYTKTAIPIPERPSFQTRQQIDDMKEVMLKTFK